jgi:ATP-dependent DNA helicase DinG
MSDESAKPGAGGRVIAALGRVVDGLPTGGELRSGQVEMASAVAKAIEAGRHLIVQAGTGTGKSLGYLVPIALSGRRTVVVTATKALQDQLAGKDLPFLADALGSEAAGGLTFAVLKGRSNYFCRQRAAELLVAQRAATASGRQLSIDASDAGGSDALASSPSVLHDITRIVSWAGSTTTGDRADLAFEPSPVAWSALSVSAGECPGKAKCPEGETCFAELARARAAEADVTVVNTHLYGQHVRSGGWILPQHDVLVVDEAHELEDIIGESLGLEIGSSRLGFLAGRLRAVIADADSAIDLGASGRALDDALKPLAGERLRRGPSAIDDLRRAIAGSVGRVQQAIESLRTLSSATDQNAELAARATRAMTAATQLATDLQAVLDFSDSDAVDRAMWVEDGTANRGPVLRVAPIDVGPVLSAAVWENVTAVLTSATIPLQLGTRVGLPSESTDELRVDSPFDYQRQSLLYCAVHLPEPRSEAYAAASHAELRALITAAGGRTLALFTSWKAMRAAADALGDLDVDVLVQGALPKPRLIERFSTDETSCLFATMGFWQGIDVPGRSLSLVTIDKLPFSRPDEPLLLAKREKAGAAAFETIDLPRAAMLLAQGSGRLIRTTEDRGVVAVLDRRLNTARYRWKLIEQLPPMRRTRDRAEVERFLREITE